MRAATSYNSVFAVRFANTHTVVCNLGTPKTEERRERMRKNKMVVAKDKNKDNCAGRKPPRPVSAKRQFSKL